MDLKKKNIFGNKLSYFGNNEILNNYKIGFLCSRRVPADIILKTYDWAIKQRDEGKCVISGFHSKIEKDVFHFLLKGNQPIILVLARGLYKQCDKVLIDEVNKNRLLIISPFPKKIDRVTQQTALKRNETICELADEMFIPYISPNSSLNNLINIFQQKLLKY